MSQCPDRPGCDHSGFTHREFISHLFEKCPCGHSRGQHPDGGCSYCECPLFGCASEEAGRFLLFLAWKQSGSAGTPPANALPQGDLVPPPNPCPACRRENAARAQVGEPPRG